jgi:hypothetical protein
MELALVQIRVTVEEQCSPVTVSGKVASLTKAVP